MISNSPNTPVAHSVESTSSARSSSTWNISINSNLDQSSIERNINPSEVKSTDYNTTVKSSTPGFEAILTLAGLITAGFILTRKM